MPYPPDMLEPQPNPVDDVEFRRELAHLLNRWGVDNWAEIPDHILADVLANLIGPIRWGRIATAKWMGQPLLGEKLSASPAASQPWDGRFWECGRCGHRLVPGPVAPDTPPSSCSVCPNTNDWTLVGAA